MDSIKAANAAWDKWLDGSPGKSTLSRRRLLTPEETIFCQGAFHAGMLAGVEVCKTMIVETEAAQTVR